MPERGLDTDTPNEVDEPSDTRNPIPLHRLFYSSATFVRVNPLGLQSTLKLGHRLRLQDSESILFNDTYLFTAASAVITPAFSRVGAHVEVQPIALWKAWASYELVAYFGTFNQIASFDGPNQRYSDKTLEDIEGTPTLGSVFTAGTTLQAKVGPIAARSTFQATRFDLDLESGTHFYDQYWDRLAPNRRFMFLNDFDVLALAGKARIGARWTWSNSGPAGSSADGDLAHHRLGPLFAWQFANKGPGARLDQPTFFMLTQWWMQHPYRTGEEQPLGLPLIAVGFAFRGDLIGPKPPTPVAP